MEPNDLEQRLSRISTMWTVMRQAPAAGVAPKAGAWNSLVERYLRAAYRYLLGAVRDPELAEELCQEFALRFIRGDFGKATPERGRFRDYIRTSLIHMVTDFHRRRQAAPGPLPEQVAAPPEAASSESFESSWKEELLDRAWRGLAEENDAYHAVLKAYTEQPDLPSPEMARLVGERLSREVTSDWVRKTKQRAHEKFATLLLDEVAASLEGASRAELEQELKTLDLLRYCKTALQKWAPSA
jgi:RNA polymerase sigma factor (sigma-70 family)